MLKTPSFCLDGKRALVVGAGSGIGQACALAIAEYGAELTIADIRKQGLEETAQIVKELGYSPVKIELIDISDINATEKMVYKNGPYNILLNAVGISRYGPAIDMPEKDYDAVFNINMKAAYFLTRAVARGLIKQKKKGSLINIASQMAKVGGIDRSVYAATKHALAGMTKSMAIEWGMHGIRVNTICPTFIRTALTESTFEQPERVKWIKDKIKLGRIGKVEDLMGPVVLLASDAGEFITGSTLLIDGGWTAG